MLRLANEENLAPPFKPGQSGNLRGRPKGSISLVAIMRRQLAEDDGADAEAIIRALITDAKRKTYLGHQSRKLALEYIDGRALSGPEGDGGPVVRIVDNI